MSEMPEPEAVKKKKKRMYTKSAVKVTVDGKLYRGEALLQEGRNLILKTKTGTVFINMDRAVRPIEVVGEVSRINTLPGRVGMPTPVYGNDSAPAPVASGLAATRFAAMRTENIENLLKMPQFENEAEVRIEGNSLVVYKLVGATRKIVGSIPVPNATTGSSSLVLYQDGHWGSAGGGGGLTQPQIMARSLGC